MESTKSKIEKIQKLNPNIEILNVSDSIFEKYGKILDLKCKNKLIDKLINETAIPNEGNVYKAFVRSWEEKDVVEELSTFYDEKIEIGYCNGQNTKLNALEWHDCDEINIFSTDALLFLAKIEDLENYKLNSKKVKAFYVEKNTALLMYKDTLHFAPCKIEDSGFKAIVVLSDLTNTELDIQTINKSKEDQNSLNSLLFKNNKFIICHEEATNLTNQGVQANINGENYNLKI
ncbi:MAG: DUF4867 family protein [Pleomorphochaeta sp.]